jgi:hypothetical protein
MERDVVVAMMLCGMIGDVGHVFPLGSGPRDPPALAAGLPRCKPEPLHLTWAYFWR